MNVKDTITKMDTLLAKARGLMSKEKAAAQAAFEAACDRAADSLTPENIEAAVAAYSCAVATPPAVFEVARALEVRAYRLVNADGFPAAVASVLEGREAAVRAELKSLPVPDRTATDEQLQHYKTRGRELLNLADRLKALAAECRSPGVCLSTKHDAIAHARVVLFPNR